MGPLSLRDYTQHFYKKNVEFLATSYPGIKIERIEDELKNFFLLKGEQLCFDSLHNESATSLASSFFSELLTGRPLEYITGISFFYTNEFLVNENVLIPRSETEIIVERILGDINKPLRLLDIGTGSGVIALSLACESKFDLEIFASDISAPALEVFKKNYSNLKNKISKQTKLSTCKSDRLESIQGQFDLIVSNPPYIKTRKDVDNVHSQVHLHEPHLALYIDDEVYDNWFKKLFEQVLEHLYDSGKFYMEGHEDHLEMQREMALNCGFREVELLKDYTNRWRFLIAKK